MTKKKSVKEFSARKSKVFGCRKFVKLQREISRKSRVSIIDKIYSKCVNQPRRKERKRKKREKFCRQKKENRERTEEEKKLFQHENYLGWNENKLWNKKREKKKLDNTRRVAREIHQLPLLPSLSASNLDTEEEVERQEKKASGRNKKNINVSQECDENICTAENLNIFFVVARTPIFPYTLWCWLKASPQQNSHHNTVECFVTFFFAVYLSRWWRCGLLNRRVMLVAQLFQQFHTLSCWRRARCWTSTNVILINRLQCKLFAFPLFELIGFHFSHDTRLVSDDNTIIESS